MLRRRLIQLLLIAFGLVPVFLPAMAFGQPKITLNSGMLYNFSTKGEARLLVDEQAIAGDPAAGLGGSPVTVFSPGWINKEIYYPAMVVVDLGRSYQISSLWLYDVNDSDSIFVFSGDPSDWTLKAAMLLDNYNTWRAVSVQDSARFVMFRYKSPSTRIGEIVVYGVPNGPVPPTPAPVELPKPYIHQFMGVNGFINDPVDKLACVGSVREYHNWGWDEGNLDTTYQGYPDNQYAWNPSWVSGTGWAFNFDEFYQNTRNSSLITSPDLQTTAPYITGFNDSLSQFKPLRPGEDPLDPLSYIEHSDYMFQFAARYGKTPVSASLLKLRPDQAPVTGSGLVRYLENWNEPDKWWFGRAGYFTPDELATMSSADYDGANNTMGPGKGMKTSDPQIRMVMGGLASLNLEYVRCMKIWSDFNRQNGFPADVLNFHHYSGNGHHGISPEADSLKFRLAAVVHYRDSCLPGKEIWLSEFGYDTNPQSEQAAVAIDTNDTYEVQGQWIMRSYLEAIASGIDKAFVFMLRDANAANPNIYNSSGLTNEIWYGQQPKKSWFYVNTMKNQLTGLRYGNAIPSGRDSVNVYKFTSQTGDTTVYAVWCSSSSNKVVNNFQLNIGPHATAWMITPQNGKPGGTLSLPPVQNGAVTFRVTERPVFIRTFATISPVPFQNNLNNVVIPGGNDTCFDALLLVRVAGDNTAFRVETGGSATILAGQMIMFMPGAVVEPGGRLSARITTTGSFCEPDTPVERPALLTHVTKEHRAGDFFKVYPNPSNGKITIALNPEVGLRPMNISVYRAQGELVMQQTLSLAGNAEISFAGQPAGLYTLRLVTDHMAGTARIIRIP